MHSSLAASAEMFRSRAISELHLSLDSLSYAGTTNLWLEQPGSMLAGINHTSGVSQQTSFAHYRAYNTRCGRIISETCEPGCQASLSLVAAS